ncbi:MAG: hypothetical protein JNK87_28045 [Bryobacterales bacterium]|nr:hypothetical protein [Bryobacterales bacterium]
MRGLILITALCLGAMGAHAKPNFSGAWKLVADKSDFGFFPLPQKYEQEIQHQDPELKLKQTQSTQQGEVTVDFVYSTDGEETSNQVRGVPVKTVMKWDEDSLKMEYKLSVQGNDITVTERWVMAEDGKTYSVSRKIVSPQGDVEMKLVLEKQ